MPTEINQLLYGDDVPGFVANPRPVFGLETIHAAIDVLDAWPCSDGVWRVLLERDDEEHPRLDGIDP